MKFRFFLLLGLYAAPLEAQVTITHLQTARKDGYYFLDPASGKEIKAHLDLRIQKGLRTFLRQRGNPMSAAVVVEVATGKLLAMVEGRRENSQFPHLATFAGFPAASLFKTVTAAAALEVADLPTDRAMALSGGCAKVNPRATWLKDQSRPQMTLRRAYGVSCNSFFAKLSIKYLGLKAIEKYAQLLGWGAQIPTDFYLPKSPIFIPDPQGSNAQTVGKFSAGFGSVGISAVHAAWLHLMIARHGQAIPILLFSEPSVAVKNTTRVLSDNTATKLLDISGRTVRSGTATSAFRRRGYRHLLRHVGGKTGSLTGPDGLTTWFAGTMPLENPEVVVAAVVVTNGSWVIKGPHLAAEAFRLWKQTTRL